MLFRSVNHNYSAAIAPTGHAPAQVPQSTQVSALISYFPSPAAIAPTGHSPSQVPQLTQESEITYAMSVSSFDNIQNMKLCILALTYILIQKQRNDKYIFKYIATSFSRKNQRMRISCIWHMMNISINSLHNNKNSIIIEIPYNGK